MRSIRPSITPARPMAEDSRDPVDDLQQQFMELLNRTQAAFMGGDLFSSGATTGTTDTPDPTKEEEDRVLQRIRDFSLKPREVRDYLDRFVVQQEEAKKVLAVTVCDHYNHVRRCLENPEAVEQEYAKPNIILLGPTGVGKTYLMRCIARLVGVPFVKADATKFSETGYVGNDVEDIVRDLVRAADGSIEWARYGIIYIDEIDKIAGQQTAGGRDVSGRGVQINLLKLMEETEVNLHSQTDLIGQMQAIMEMQRQGGRSPSRTINTRHMLFIVSGAFDKLADIVRTRLERSRIGFAHDEAGQALDRREINYLPSVNTADFIQFGFEPEFIGRLPVRVVCDPLTSGDLEQVLVKSEGSVLLQFREDLQGYGITLHTTSDAIKAIARRAAEEKTGARGLMTVLERILRDFKFELPSTGVKHLEINADTVKDPGQVLQALLEQNRDSQIDLWKADVQQFAERFQLTHGLKLVFEEAAIDALCAKASTAGKTMRTVCEDIFRNFEYGLSLISRNTGRETFTITDAVIAEPDQELSKWVVASHTRNKE